MNLHHSSTTMHTLQLQQRNLRKTSQKSEVHRHTALPVPVQCSWALKSIKDISLLLVKVMLLLLCHPFHHINSFANSHTIHLYTICPNMIDNCDTSASIFLCHKGIFSQIYDGRVTFFSEEFCTFAC